MFEEDKEEWKEIFDYYLEIFKEEVGVLCGVIDSDDFEADLFLGEDSGEVRGLRLYQVLEIEGGDEEEEEKDSKQSEEKKASDSEETPKEGDTEQDDEEDEEEDEEEYSEVLAYDLIAKPKAKVVGKVAYEETVEIPSDKEGEKEGEGKKYTLKIYTTDGDVNSEVTCVSGNFEGKIATRTIFLEPPELK